jgi:hypothetical protein
MLGRLVIFCTVIAIGLTSCKFDACENIICLNNGICESGNCVCQSGFEGHNCETEQRLAFVSDYNVQESCNLGNFNYIIGINANSSVGTEIKITNFGDFGYEVSATVAENGFEIPSQIHSGDTISGTGELDENVLSIGYTLITEQADTLVCSITCISI